MPMPVWNHGMSDHEGDTVLRLLLMDNSTMEVESLGSRHVIGKADLLDLRDQLIGLFGDGEDEDS